MRLTAVILLLIALTIPGVAHGQAADVSDGAGALDFSGARWIWHPSPDVSTVYFRKSLTFDRRVERIDIFITADDSYEVEVNGRMIGSAADWQNPQRYEVPRPVARESSVILVKAVNRADAAGLICKLAVHLQDGTTQVVVTDGTWECADAPDGSADWVRARVVGEYPCKPWGAVLRESWESLRARLVHRRQDMAASLAESGEPKRYSEFKGEYVRPEYADLYRSFVKLNPKTGLLEYEGRVVRPFFTVYSQPAEASAKAGGWILNIPELDFDLLEKDFAGMKQAGINVQARFWNWSELLNYDGTWKEVEKQPEGHGLPYFKYVYEMYGYFLDRAQAHGLYVNVEPSFYWGLHPLVVPPQYRGKILLHDELWRASRDAYAKILRYYSKRTVIVSVMVGEEDLVFDHCLDEPEMLDQFRRYLRREYGSISNLKRTWTHGYDYADRSKWTKREVAGRQVLWPEYSFVEGAFNSWYSFEDVRLPILDYCRSADPPNAPLADLPTYQENLPRDPVWIDFLATKERLLVSRLNDLADALGSADPNHVLYYCNPHDFNPAWHMLHCFGRGRLRFDVIGVGQHDSALEPSEVPRWATCREYIQNVASYGPYVGASGACPKGFACGEGRGGKTREGVAEYYPWWLTDIVGGGGAFFQSYDWNYISGRTYEDPTAYDDSVLDRLGEFLTSVRHAPFSRRGDVEVLILRNGHAARGMSAGCDFGNARSLAGILYGLHIPFDILPDSDVTLGAFEPGKVNLNNYRFIFVPAQNQLLSRRTWQMLEDWIADPRYAGRRGLCLGLYQDQDCYFSPRRPTDVHPAFERLTGTRGYSRRIPASGPVTLRCAKFLGAAARGDELHLQFPKDGEIGCFEGLGDGLETILELGEDGPAVVMRNLINGNPVYTCGFYLGLAYDAVWGTEVEQSPHNVLNPLYAGMLGSAGVEPRISAPDNLGVYIADDGSAMLVKERFGQATDVVLSFGNPSGAVFQGTTTILDADGSARIQGLRVEPYGTLVLRKAAGVAVSGGTDVSSICKPSPEGGLELAMSGRGEVKIAFELTPSTIYSARENGKLIKVFTADHDGRHTMSLDLGDGSKDLQISITPSSR